MTAIDDLINQWDDDVKSYLRTPAGSGARRVLNLCRKELIEALKDVDGKMRVELKELVAGLNAESARKRIRVMQTANTEDGLEINKDPASWSNGYHMGVDYAVRKLKVAAFYKTITGDKEVLTQ